MTNYLNFGTHSISLERFELQDRHADSQSTGCINDKNEKNRSKGVGKGSRNLLLEFFDPLNISGMV